MSAPVWIGVALLGGVGAILRFLVDAVISERTGRAFPFGTLGVNISGAVALGAITGAALHGPALMLEGTATVGSYTTFSTWMLESQRLTEEGEARGALGNIVVSLALGLGAAALGRYLTSHL